MLAEVYAQSYRRLRATASRYVEAQDAEDMVHDAFVRALQRQDGFRRDASAATWMHRIVVNSCLNARRRERRGTRVAHLLEVTTREVAHVPFTEGMAVRRAFRALSRGDRLMCILYDVMGLTHQEIATTLRVPVGTSKYRLSMARRRLRRMIEDGTSRSSPS